MGNPLLDSTLDSLPDLPTFAAFPSGAYRVELNKGLVEKEIGGHPAVEMNMKCLEVMELADASEPAPEVGAECNTAFMLDNDTGLGFFKEVLKALNPAYPGTIRETMEACKGAECIVVIKKTHDKDKDRDYTNVKKFALV